MKSDDIRLLYEYDRWANRRVWKAASALSSEQFTRDLGGGFRSVRDMLLHIIGGEWIWLAYWKNPPATPEALAVLLKRRDASLSPDAIPDLDTLQRKAMGIETELTQFVNRLSDQDLEKLLPFRNTQLKLVHLLQHLANHSTYHRGQLAMAIRQLGAEPLATDFHVFLVDSCRNTVTKQGPDQV